MNNMEKITKMTGQYEKEMELAEKYRNKAKECTELAEKHLRKAGDLEKEIKYEKGGEVFDRVNALSLSPEELQMILKLLDDRTQLLDVVRKLYPERIQDNGGDQETTISRQDIDPDKPEKPYSGDEEIPVYGESSTDSEDAEIPVFGEDDNEDDGKGEKTWSA